MKKVILIEDRPERMRMYLETLGASGGFNKYPFFDLKTGDNFIKLKNALEDNTYTEHFQLYDVIICHRSAFPEPIRQKIKDYCRSQNKALVFFSGGIAEGIYQNIGYPFLAIHSRILYSKNLFLFLERVAESEVEISIIQYGKNWQINQLLTIRNKVNFLILYPNKTDFEYVSRRNELKSLLKNSFSIFSNDNWSEDGIRDIKIKIDTEITSKFAFGL